MERTRTSHILLILFRILFTILVLWTLWFIFHNALEPGALSSARSQAFTDMLNRGLAKVGVHPLTNAAVRKLAHFGEYCLLGFGYTLCLRVYTRHYIRHISWPLLLGLLVANADETLQWLLASGRDGNLKDVWIDFMGCSCGVLCAICLLLIVSLMVMALRPKKR
jgi:VanZ family protein